MYGLVALGGFISQAQLTHNVLHSFTVIVLWIFMNTKSPTPTLVLKVMLHWQVALLLAKLFEREALAVSV